MKILNVKLFDLGIVIGKNLVICDLHIGIEEALHKQGIFLPKFHIKDVIKRMEYVIHITGYERLDKIIINGDIKHEFGKISEEEWRNVLKFIDFISRYCDEIILVKGNHDMILGPIADKRGIRVVENYRVGNVLICHGDKLPGDDDLKDVSTIIIGHEHPAIIIREGAKSEKFKCYLVGDYLGKSLIVQPSLNLLTEGTAVNEGKMLSPFLQGDIRNFNVIAVGDDLYEFGKLKNLI